MNYKNYLTEATTNIYSTLEKDYPKANKQIGNISKAVEWDIQGAMSFCLHLLEDVNAHSEMKEVERLFTKQMKKFME